MIEQFPELADQGFWYVMPARFTEDGIDAPLDAGTGYTAVYGSIEGSDYVAVRAPDVLAGIEAAPASVSAVLAGADVPVKPFGRIGGH